MALVSLSIFIYIFHILAFMIESVFFMSPKIYQLFGLSTRDEAKIMKVMAFNQGFYNLFLALSMALGLAFYMSSDYMLIGVGIMISSSICMAGAGIVLVISEPKAWLNKADSLT